MNEFNRGNLIFVNFIYINENSRYANLNEKQRFRFIKLKI